jgi:hypothetical protein
VSKAFTRESDDESGAEEIPSFRSQLPPGTRNYIQTSGFGRIEAIVATIRVLRDIHVRPNVAGLGIPQMAKRTIAEDLGV